MYDTLKALIIGIIQGLTEFLPVSSSGHIELGQALLNFSVENEAAFSIIVHLATVLSTIIIFRKDITQLCESLFTLQWNRETKFVAYLLISSLPIIVVAVFFKNFIEGLFIGKLILVGCMLIVTSALLYSTTIVKPKKGKLTFGKAIAIGIAQTIAILPGISRSGATISMALNLGIEREQAARFSFLMVLIPIIGASALEIIELTQANELQNFQSLPMLAGFIGAFLSGLAACSWMLKIVKKGKIQYFAYYCFILGIITIFVAWN